MSAHVPNHTHSNFTPQRGLKVVDFVCRKMQQQMKHDVSLGGSWFKLFQKYDADSSGMLDFGELVHVLRKEVKIRKTEVSDNELHLLWATFDSDGSGFVTIKEFSGFMRRYQHFGKASFLGKIPITPMANVKELSNAIMEAGKAMMKEDNKLVLDEVTTQFQGTEYQEFAGWLHANADRYDECGNGRIDCVCNPVMFTCPLIPSLTPPFYTNSTLRSFGQVRRGRQRQDRDPRAGDRHSRIPAGDGQGQSPARCRRT